MYDFVLSFVASGAGWLLCAESILAGQAPPLAFSAMRFTGSTTVEQGASRDMVSSQATPARPSWPSWQADPWQAAQLGGELYRAVFREGVEELFRRALDEARERRAGLRLLIKARQLQEVHEVPWELLHDGRRFLAQRLETPVVRPWARDHARDPEGRDAFLSHFALLQLQQPEDAIEPPKERTALFRLPEHHAAELHRVQL